MKTNRLAQIGVLQNGTLNFKTGIDEILHIEAFGVWFFFDRLWLQLQTRWNFTLCRAISAGTKSVSIPNGMEFYTRPKKFPNVTAEFQFPTGWNSTLFGQSLCRWVWVSIPNGMEFYGIDMTKQEFVSKRFNSKRDGILRSRFGESTPKIYRFNSQRDGILLIADFICTTWAEVSIPNGMEFYVRTARHRQQSLSFNSQRDGILHAGTATAGKTRNLFQFPTGWNSTYVVFITERRYRGFQFPTGWNSTLKTPS